jgi:flagellar FliL protein
MQEREAAEIEADNATPQKQSKDTPEEEVFETIYHEFPGTFTTNLSGSRKMLQVGIGVSTQYDDTVMMNVEAHQLALRSVILGVISDFTEDNVKGATGRDTLAVALRDSINAKLEALENFGGVEEVHFTSFVLQ